MTNKNRAVTLILAIAIGFTILFSFFCIAVQPDHDCIGEDCPVCTQISLCEDTVKSLELAVLKIIAAIISAYFCIIQINVPVPYRKQVTPVSMKVKLSN